MQKIFKLVVVLSTALTGTALHAEKAVGFDNFLLKSPSHFSPSQNYQVRPQGRFEGFLGFESGSTEASAASNNKSIDITGNEIAVSGLFAPSELLVVGLNIDYITTEFKDDIKITATDIEPQVSFSLTPMFSLGLGVHIVSGKNESKLVVRDEDFTDQTVSFNYITLGATLHQNDWEGTVVFNTENKDDKKTYNNHASSFTLAGRYRVVPPLALGLSYSVSDESSLAKEGDTAEDQSRFGLHVDSIFTDSFTMEFAYFSTSAVSGTKGFDSSELIALAKFQISPTLDLGARLAYETQTQKNYGDTSIVRPGVFIRTQF